MVKRIMAVLQGLLCVLALWGEPAQAETYAFAAVKDAGVSAENLALGNYEFTDETFRLDGGLASAQGVDNAAMAQALPGVNRISVSNATWVTDEFIRQTGWGGPMAIGMSIWTDHFTITGGEGVGQAMVSVSVTGQFGSGVGAQGGYALWRSNPSDLQREREEFLRADPLAWLGETLDDPEDVGVTLVLSHLAWVPTPGYVEPEYEVAEPGDAFGGILVATIDFVYGEPFSIASGLYGFANDTGSLMAMNSAHFGISIQNNASAQILSRSGAVYAAAVPEPELWLLVLAGWCVLWLRRQRRRSGTGVTLLKPGLWVAAAWCVQSAHGGTWVGGSEHFTAVRTQIEIAGCDDSPTCVVQSALGVDVEGAGSVDRAYALARADYGVNGGYASVKLANDLEAYAESIWSDAFTVTGGEGHATAHLSVRIDGSIDGFGVPGGPGSNAFYVLFVSDAPMYCDFDEVTCTGARAIILTEPLSGAGDVLQAQIEFTFGQPFYLASYLGAEVVGGGVGVADFYHSAHLGISVADGQVSVASGAVYASAVPEPSAWTLLLSALCGAGLAAQAALRAVIRIQPSSELATSNARPASA